MMHINYCLKTDNAKEIPGRRQLLFSPSFDNGFPEEFVVFSFQLMVGFHWQLGKLTMLFIFVFMCGSKLKMFIDVYNFYYLKRQNIFTEATLYAM